jgi:hypothetical protein
MATVLYLVSAETAQGEGYWKVGVTAKADPLKRNTKAYREVFRAQVFESAEVAKDVELAVARVFKALAPTPYGRETLAYSAGLEVAAAVFDFCFEERLKWESPPEPAATGNDDRDHVAFFTTANFFCRKERPGQEGFGIMPWGEAVRKGKLDHLMGAAQEALALAERDDQIVGCASPSHHVRAAQRELRYLPACISSSEEDAWSRYFDMVEACQQIIDAVVVAKAASEPMWA